MRIAILTFHKAYNCGAMLQAWALKTVLEGMGHTVVFPDCNNVGDAPRFRSFSSPHQWPRKFLSLVNYVLTQMLSVGSVDLRRRLHRRFLNRHFNTVACPVDGIHSICDAAIYGSDQIWNLSLLRKEDPVNKAPEVVFLGEREPKSFPKISYAASLGDHEIGNPDLDRVMAAARDFSAVSLRESISAGDFRDKRNRGAQVVVDPSLLLDKENYIQIANPSRMKRGRYLLVYALLATPFVCQCARKASEYMGLPVVILSMYQYGKRFCPKDVRVAFGPAEWLAWFRDAEAVLAMSFHGTAFSVLFNKPFVSLRNKVDTRESRPAAFLREIGALERLVTPDRPDTDWLPLLSKPVGGEQSGILGALREHSLRWLENAIGEVVL